MFPRLQQRPEEMLVTKTILRFICDETGATAIEYGLIAAGISIAIIVAVAGVGSSLNTSFTSVQTALK
jgi:pilus assembly protein Flp/PilA